MDFVDIERKWRTRWKDTDLYRFDPTNPAQKCYVLEMFSYPSAAKLHIGHWFNFGPADSYARYKRMKGFNVFHPMGFDAFGLPAENYAIKTGVHPSDSTERNISTMREQLDKMGATFDWDHEVITCRPDYYRWTQWIFLQLYKKGLAYRKEAPVNWCPSCQTVLANEQVVDGACERCHTTVIRKNLTQWFFKITAYADELLDCLPQLDWPEKTKLMQKNWIGRSKGGEVEFTTDNGKTFRVFTTRADTLFGVSYVVLAPEHPLVDELTTPEQREAVEAYKLSASQIDEIERTSTTREKTGVFTGAYCTNPINGKRVPIWAADYVLYSYGTGAVMGVPSHDDRDYAFALKHDLPIIRVVKGVNGNDDLPFCEYGISCNSGEFDGLTTEECKDAILEKLASMNKGGKKINYRLRDWLISRQRYWGAPIPMIHCPKCGTVPVPEDQLPVLLPRDVEFAPDGKSPLAKCASFMNVKCPCCGGDAQRDPDTLDTFVCSSWYYLRYVDNKNSDRAWDPAKVNALLPVDKYIGGAEHACMHLLYARFFTKALRDMGLLNFDEPFRSLIHQGIILGPDGNKMSKSWGNIVSPDDYVDKYGADTFRMYLMFGFSFVTGGPWSDDGIKAINKYLERVERLVLQYKDVTAAPAPLDADAKKLNYVRHSTIKCVDADMENFSFNTAIARLMELVNAIYKYIQEAKQVNVAFVKDVIKDLILLLAPITPHVAEELNEINGGAYSIHNESYPVYDPSALVLSEVEIVVQINSKIRGKCMIPTDADDETIRVAALAALGANAPATYKKAIVIKGKLINFVV